MARTLTPFESDRRSDLIAGHGNRWTVSSPRDELEKFRFFAHQIEVLVDRAEGAEVESLRTSIEHLPKGRQDEFWLWNYPGHWDDIFRSAIRSSLVVSLASFLETYLVELRRNVGLLKRSEVDLKERKGGTLVSAQRFLEGVGHFRSPPFSEWEAVRLFFKIRNVIVHAAGFTVGIQG